MLENIFTILVNPYNKESTQSMWQEIKEYYSHKSRKYHNLTHLENLYKELSFCKELIEDWDTVLFALFYHDIIYKSTRNDNEEQSAELALQRLKEINYPEDKAERCRQMILATKSHLPVSDNDINLFTDADLSILGYDWSRYAKYYKQVREEYSYYPDILYKPGRKKVLKHFLSMSFIYKTEFFRAKYEENAKENIRKELTKL
ncbi:hypothetical protein Q763_05750 [Flavobacterium beibuense F44-8]|uniref:Metal-dependent HD superfamily phosphohydrolase n=1 Tax=Flavobacterium beibuense F44-8 TaxID=1406840 RepID=A0A0A2LQL9_9FLAO|nr:hypothetical protein [Flavobacterium beibuense]KGO82597.1 hypothetical protein Q763_05750 [Flavobacterium beibuense F44-8]